MDEVRLLFRDGRWAAIGQVDDHRTVKATIEGADVVVTGIRRGEESAVEMGRCPSAEVEAVVAALVWPEAEA